MKLCIYNLLVCVLLCQRNHVSGSDFIRGFLQTNLIGSPVVHQVMNWTFDPEEGDRRSVAFQELNGIKSEKLIERFGLGLDGREKERLARQRERDEGHLGGLNYFLP